MSKSKISPLVFVPPAIFALLAGLFLSGMFRDDPDGLPSTRVGGTVPALVLLRTQTEIRQRQLKALEARERMA
jgi:hypothetical protein